MNPFIKNKQILPIASINSVYIDNILASDLFRPKILIDEINKYRIELGIPKSISDEKLIFTFNNSLSSKDKTIKNKAHQIAVLFGRRLAQVVLTLKNPSELSVINRPDWNTEHWNFWKEIEHIIFVGGLTSPILTNIFFREILSQLKKLNIKNLRISFIEGSGDLGTEGLTNLVEDGEYLLFDFGQTNIKRRHHIKNNGDVVIDSVLPSILSQYLFYKDKDKVEIDELSKLLHRFIIKTIYDTVISVDFQGSSILVGIANYVYEGNIYSSRGGYGKLAFIGGNYQTILSSELSNLIGREIEITLVHDTTAMALNFKGEEKTAVISLGTAFGVAFPQ